MRGWITKVALAAALVGFTVPALACDAMKSTHASATTTSTSTAKTSEKAQKTDKTEKKSAAKKETVASAQQAKR